MSIAFERATSPPALVEAAGDDVATCSSSIGRNSGGYGGSEGGDEAEVQSSLKGPLDTMDALEDSLPFRRGVSRFYYGKSKSFAIISDVLPSSSSAKALARTENSNNNNSRKRKNKFSFDNCLENKPPFNAHESNGVSKRPTNSSRSTTLHRTGNSMSGSSQGSNSVGSSTGEEHHSKPIAPKRNLSFPISSAGRDGVLRSSPSSVEPRGNV